MELNKPIVVGTYGNQKIQFCQARRIFSPKGISPTLSAAMGMGGGFVPVVLVSPKSTNTPSKSTKPISQPIRNTAMLQISNAQMSQILTYSAEVSPASLSQSPVNVAALVTHGVHSFLKLLGLHRKNSHAFYCLKMLKGFYLTTKGVLSELSSARWMNLGMTCNGKCLTVKTSVSPRTENGCLLSDILEPQVAPKYFLSMDSEWVKRIQRSVLQKEDIGVKGTALMLNRTPKQTDRIHNPSGISPTIPTSSGGRHIPMICESADSPRQNVNGSKDSRTAGQQESPIPNATNVLEMP